MSWGPDVQYSTEKQWDNLEIRIYTGADGSFTLYEDENDNYNYEQGKRSTIKFTWDDAQQTLTIGARDGEFDGMLKTRTFNIIGINKDDNPADQHATVSYDGTETNVKIDPTVMPSGIVAVKADTAAKRQGYTLSGKPATESTKGIVVEKGRKVLNR